MKKIYVAMAVLGTVLLSSCVQEKNFKKIKVGENELAFVMRGISTRSGEEAAAPAVKGITIPMKKVLGDAVYLEETIEELNGGPATKGAPAYTVTLPDVYPSMGVYADGKFGDAAFQMYDQYGDGWRYNHNYNGSPWPEDKTEDVDFYLRMPATGGGVTYSKTSFELTSPENGKDQKDLLFGQVTMSKEFHDSKLPGGVPVTMQHALAGIKFRNGHPNGTQTKTIITKVELIGLNSHGKGTIGVGDDAGVVTWTDVNTPSTEDAPFYLEFDNADYSSEAGVDGTVKEWNEKLAGTTWGDAAADHNLNNADGELTFWFIPQEISDDLILNIEFYVKTPDTPNGTLVPHTIKLGELLNAKSMEANNKKLTWEAGQLRTYTLKPYDVDVEIEDTISETVKEKLHIANTGNVDEYVRMLIMGNWYGWDPSNTSMSGDPSILVGYKYKDADDAAAHNGSVDDMVDPWFRGGYKQANGVYADPYGYFDGTFTLGSLGEVKSTENPDSRNGARDDWADASGGYYYTMPIGPGDGVHTAVSATTDLFKSYTVTNVPTIYIPVGDVRKPALGVHLVMEIVVQAIAVPKDEEGKDVWWLQAWYDATKVAKLDPTAGRNAGYVALYEAGEYDPED